MSVRRTARRRHLTVGVAVSLMVLAGCSSQSVGSPNTPSSSSAGSTTPLGCPAPVPAFPRLAEGPQLECTERALIAEVCNLDPTALVREDPGGIDSTFLVRYQQPGTIFHAEFVYTNNTDVSSDGVNMACTIPPHPTKKGVVELRRQDWETVAAGGTDLPAVLQPQNVAVSSALAPSLPSSQVPSAPTRYAPNPGDPACSTQATSVFRRLAEHQLNLAQARAQLPGKVPPSALERGLQGVQRYESEGISPSDAITEASGAIAQSCEY